MCRRLSISSRMLVSFFMALTTSDMSALSLPKVNRSLGRFGEEEAHECIGQDGGCLVDGLIERGVAIAHERSP